MPCWQSIRFSFEAGVSVAIKHWEHSTATFVIALGNGIIEENHTSPETIAPGDV